MKYVGKNTWWIAGMISVLGLAGCGGGAGPGVTSGGPVEARSQPTGQDDPVWSQRDVAEAPVPAQIRLAALSSAKLQADATAPVVRQGIARQIGVPRDLAATASPSLTAQQFLWQPTAAGGQSAALSFTSGGATGLRLGLLVKRLPWEARISVYAQGSAQAFSVTGSEVLAAIHRNVDAEGESENARTYWTPGIEGEEVTLEISLPAGTPTSAVEVAVPRLSHWFESPTATPVARAKIGESEYCEQDINCSSGYQSESNATAKMSFVSNGKSYVCSGTLLNDRKGSGTPYFLSANHCISVQSEATSLTTYWFYRSASCGSSNLSASSKTLTGGAQLLYASSTTDTSFMRLNGTLPAGVNFAGWDPSAPTTNLSVIGVHHPSGDLQKLSLGTVKGYSACTTLGSTGSFSCSPSTQSAGQFLTTQWSSGVTEGGSSGSGLFKTVAGSRYLIGQLYGGSSSCSNQTGTDDYGRFDLAYNASLKTWLENATATPKDAVYRFYNNKTGTHFFTINASERDYVIANYPQFNYEGAAFYAYSATAPSMSPVFRFYNTKTESHFYTINAAERDYVMATYPQFTYEGPKWYAQTTNDASVTPVYRFYNTRTATHFYTVSAAERDYVINTFPQYTYEGISYYAWSTSK